MYVCFNDFWISKSYQDFTILFFRFYSKRSRLKIVLDQPNNNFQLLPPAPRAVRGCGDAHVAAATLYGDLPRLGEEHGSSLKKTKHVTSPSLMFWSELDILSAEESTAGLATKLVWRKDVRAWNNRRLIHLSGNLLCFRLLILGMM